MAGTQYWGDTLRGLGITGLVVGLLLIGVSFVAGKDAEDPRCGGKAMGGDDTCYSSKSGPQSYDERASNAQAASTWLLRIGGGLAVSGVGAIVVGSVASRRY
ncbi:hypothetical protein [Actinomadura hibisca]|uniref:hypothetical protein n=1 Tax=Actinomadura hibisca TaxID=68565 RepID=UPI00083557E4|nr:hypothetical protein [Actinomadura hibisca]